MFRINLNRYIKISILMISLIVFQIGNVSLAACGEWHQIHEVETSLVSSELPCENCPEHEAEEQDCCNQSDGSLCHLTVFINESSNSKSDKHIAGSLSPILMQSIPDMWLAPPGEPPKV